MQYNKRKYINLALLSSLLWNASFGQAADLCPANTNPAVAAPPAQAVPTSCGSENWEKVAAYVQQKVTLLKIATSKADFKLLAEHSGAIEQIVGTQGICNRESKPFSKAELLAKVCDVDCAVQRASAALFNVSELPFLSNQTTGVGGGNVIEEAERGTNIIKEALNFIVARNRGGSEDKDSSGNTSSFNQFLRDKARLQAVHSRLLIAQGDALYKNLSRTRATTLRQRIRNVLEVTPGETKVGEETDLAMGYYESASWALQEALIDLPMMSNNTSGEPNVAGQVRKAADFSRLRQELESLKLDVEQRLTSIRKGFLFLNIDPEAFTTLTTDQLAQLLYSQTEELKALEDQIAELVKNWQDKKSDAERRRLDAQRLRDDRSLEVKGMQIANYEAYADQVRTKFESLISEKGYQKQESDAKVEIIRQQQMLSDFEFELKKLQREAKGQIAAVESQRQLDLTVLSRERHQETRDNLKWLVDATLTAMNLELQINEYQAQIADFSTQITIKETDRDSLDKLIKSKEALKTVEQSRRKEYQAQIDRVNEQSTTVYTANLEPIKLQICALAQEYARYLNGVPETGDAGCSVKPSEFPDEKHWEEVLTVRKEFFGEDGDGGTTKEKYDKLKACLDGTGLCEGASAGTIQLAKDMYEAQKKVVEETMGPQIKKVNDIIEGSIKKLTIERGVIIASKVVLERINTGLGGAYIALAGTEVGPFPSMDLGEKAKAAYEIALSSARSLIDVGQTASDFDARIADLKIQAANLAKELETAKAQLQVDAIARDRTIAEIAGKGMELDYQRLIMRVDAKLAFNDAKAAKAAAMIEGEKIKLQIKALLAELKASKAANDLLSHEVDQYNAQIDASEAISDSLQFEIDGLNQNKLGVDRDIERLKTLKTNAEAQKNLVVGTREKVEGLNTQIETETALIRDLYAQEEAGITALSKQQIDLINASLNADTSHVEKTITYVNETLKELMESHKLVGESMALTAGMASELLKIQEKVQAKRCEMIQFAESRPDPGTREANLFLASEEIIANLTQGIPEYIRAKKTRLEYANYLYNLYRNRVYLLSEMGGPVVKKNYNHIMTAGDIQEAMRGFCTPGEAVIKHSWICDPNSLLFSKVQIPVETAFFSFPANSGFMSRLLRKGSARFEITPAAWNDPNQLQSDSDLASNGYFQLWSSAMDGGRNMSLVNLALSITEAGVNTTCSDNVTLLVRHLGYGSRYIPTSPTSKEVYPLLSVTAVRAAPQRVWTDPNAAMHYTRGLNSSGYMLGNFPEKVSHHNQSTPETHPLTYLGAPLVGTYEISFPEADYRHTLNCLRDKPLNLNVTYTKPQISPEN